jgi:protein gp37
MTRYGRDFSTVTRSKTTFYAPLKWKEPKLIFTCSWSDFFIEEADEWRAEAWEVIRRCQQHTFQILTKRPERILLPECGNDPNLFAAWPNVWIGTSVENQYWADERIPFLLQVPAAVRFLSIEPLLGPIDLSYWLASRRSPFIGWVIVGGESGDPFGKKQARPLNLDYVRRIRDQCVSAGIPFFFKQHSGNNLAELRVKGRKLDGQEWNQLPVLR